MKDSRSQWIATDCTICYHSCGMNVLVEDGRIKKVEGLKDHPLNKGRLCPKGEKAIDLVYWSAPGDSKHGGSGPASSGAWCAGGYGAPRAPPWKGSTPPISGHC